MLLFFDLSTGLSTKSTVRSQAKMDTTTTRHSRRKSSSSYVSLVDPSRNENHTIRKELNEEASNERYTMGHNSDELLHICLL